MKALKLRPHHILDIISTYGHGGEFEPHPYGHALHTVAQSILSDPDLEAELVIGADAICQPCTHLRPDGQCDDVLQQLSPPVAKQAYNDDLDTRLLDYLGLASRVVTIRDYLTVVAENLPGIVSVCTHPGEDPEARLGGLVEGLTKLGVR